jgi:hypothetical protein
MDAWVRIDIYSIGGWKDKWMSGWRDGWMNEWMDMWMAGWEDGRIVKL